MILWPKRVSRDDEQWRNALALMQVLPLDPRIFPFQNRVPGHKFLTSVEEFLERPSIYVDRRLVPAPYFSFSVQFSVSGGVCGSIPVDDEEQLAEFRRVVGAALNSELTMAERGVWEASNERGLLERKLLVTKPEDREPLRERSAVLIATATELARKAHHFYNEEMTKFLTWRESNPMGKRPGHQEVMLALIERGKQMLADPEGDVEVQAHRPRETMGG